MMRRAYRCPCGQPITVDEIVADTGWSVTLDHPGQVDAACRLVVEVLRDELIAIQRDAMARVFLRPAAMT